MVSWQKKTSSEKENKTWKVYTNGILTLNLSRDDLQPCTEVLVHYLQVLESVNLLFTYRRPKFFSHPKPQFWQNKIILPFLTETQRKHVQIHVMKTFRQASVTNSLLALYFFYFTNITTQSWMEKGFMRLFET